MPDPVAHGAPRPFPYPAFSRSALRAVAEQPWIIVLPVHDDVVLLSSRSVRAARRENFGTALGDAPARRPGHRGTVGEQRRRASCGRIAAFLIPQDRRCRTNTIRRAISLSSAPDRPAACWPTG